MAYGLDLGIIDLLAEAKMPTTIAERRPIISHHICVHEY
jgi:hypothetical protein